MTPEILFIPSNHREENFLRSRLMPVVSTHHHKDEPANTPSTTIVAEAVLLFVPPIPNPAKMAANERMVRGFVSVSTKVEAYAPK